LPDQHGQYQSGALAESHDPKKPPVVRPGLDESLDVTAPPKPEPMRPAAAVVNLRK